MPRRREESRDQKRRRKLAERRAKGHWSKDGSVYTDANGERWLSEEEAVRQLDIPVELFAMWSGRRMVVPSDLTARLERRKALAKHYVGRLPGPAGGTGEFLTILGWDYETLGAGSDSCNDPVVAERCQTLVAHITMSGHEPERGRIVNDLAWLSDFLADLAAVRADGPLQERR